MLAAPQGWLVRIKAIGARSLDVIGIVIRSAALALLWLVPVYAVLMLAVLMLAPTPDLSKGERPAAWIAPVIFGVLGGSYLALMLGYVFIHLVRKQTVPQFVNERPLLRESARWIAAKVDRIGSQIDRLITVVGKGIAHTVVALLLLAIAVLGIVLLWGIGSAAFGSAPWWAVVIIILLVLIYLK